MQVTEVKINPIYLNNLKTNRNWNSIQWISLNDIHLNNISKILKTMMMKWKKGFNKVLIEMIDIDISNTLLNIKDQIALKTILHLLQRGKKLEMSQTKGSRLLISLVLIIVKRKLMTMISKLNWRHWGSKTCNCKIRIRNLCISQKALTVDKVQIRNMVESWNTDPMAMVIKIQMIMNMMMKLTQVMLNTAKSVQDIGITIDKKVTILQGKDWMNWWVKEIGCHTTNSHKSHHQSIVTCFQSLRACKSQMMKTRLKAIKSKIFSWVNSVVKKSARSRNPPSKKKDNLKVDQHQILMICNKLWHLEKLQMSHFLKNRQRNFKRIRKCNLPSLHQKYLAIINVSTIVLISKSHMHLKALKICAKIKKGRPQFLMICLVTLVLMMQRQKLIEIYWKFSNNMRAISTKRAWMWLQVWVICSTNCYIKKNAMIVEKLLL